MSLTRRQFVTGGIGATAASVLACRGGDASPIEGEYDLLVIGSSFAGLPIALRAAQRGLRTLVVEAGGFPGRWFAGEPAMLPFTSSGAVDYPANAARMIAVGGASNHWEGAVNRMRPSDFRLRSEFGLDVDWPLSYDELEPYYCRAERDLSVRGSAAVVDAEPARSCAYPRAPDAGYRPPNVEIDGRRLRDFPLARSVRGDGPVRLVDREVEAFASSSAGTLASGHQTTRLVTLDGRRIDHALVRSADGSERQVFAKRIVLAAGVLESARLLLLSRSRWFPNGLGNARDLVGRYFTVHPTLRWQFTPPSLGRLFDGAPQALSNRTYDYADEFRRRGLNAAHFQLRVFRDESIILKHQPEIEARGANRVTLSTAETDRFGDPVADLALGWSPRDLATKWAGEDVLAATVEALGGHPDTVDKSEKWRFHPSGTLRMGFDANTGVVDRNLKVFGVENLFVSGACVFPTAGTANPTETIVALAHRLADHLLRG